MIELSILELLYLVLTFFLVIVGTLLTLVLLRVFKVLSVWVEISNYYWQWKKIFTYYSQVPYVVKDKIFDMLAQKDDSSEETQKQKIKEKDPII